MWDIECSLFSLPSRLIAMKQWDSNSGVGLKEMGWEAKRDRRRGHPGQGWRWRLTHGPVYPPQSMPCPGPFLSLPASFAVLGRPRGGPYCWQRMLLLLQACGKKMTKSKRDQERRNNYLFSFRESSQYNTGRFFFFFFWPSFLSSLNESSIFGNCEPLS